jgi:4-amino-4-deoxy-L-arabinose transferase-like glycosyltransferase
LTGYFLCPSEGENFVLHPINVSPSEIRSGLNKKVYRGNPKRQLIEEITEDRPIYFEWLSDAEKSYESLFTIEWNGLLKIEQRSDYTFVLGSDDGSELFLNDTCIIDNSGLHSLVEKRQTVFLEPGFYRFHLRYFDQGGESVLYLKWKFSNENETVIPPSQFYQRINTRDLLTSDTTIPYTLGIKPDSIIKETNVVFKKNDPAIAFKNYGILRTYYVNYWDNDRFEPPVSTPPYNILWRGSIWIPKDGAYTFHVVTNGDVFLFIDSKPVITYRAGNNSNAQVFLKKGWRNIQINYFNPEKYATLHLLWQKPGDSKLMNISSRYLKPSEDTGVFRGVRLWCGVGFVIAALSIGLGFFLVLKNTKGYLVYVKQNWSIVALIVIVILGGVLRLNNYSLIPPHGDTMDVYQEAWNGYHILHGDGPESWEYFYFLPAYNDEDKKFVQWFGDSFTIVRHYIAHPPLFSIFAAIPPTISGAKDYLDCRLTTINLTPIFFSTLTIILVFLVSYKIYRSNALSIIASLLYATVPLIVASGRIAKGDCLLALVLISGVLCVLKYTEAKQKMYVIFAGLLAGVSFWCKEMGICAILIFPLLLGRKGFARDAFITAGISFSVAAGYMLYNYLINPEAFLKILSLRSEHQSTVFDMVLKYINEPKLAQANAGFGLGYLMWFWYAMVYSMGKRDQVVPITTFIFLMTICALSKDTQPYGWFLMPLYPFMAIAGGLFMRDFISKPNTAKALLILLVLVAIPLKEILHEDLYEASWLFRSYIAIGILPFLISDFLRNQITARIAKGACYAYISLFIVMNVYIVLHLPDIYDPLKM